MKRGKSVQDPLERDLKDVNSVLNKFLKQYFTIELDSLQQYLHNVKDLLIDLTTKKMAPVLTNVFSKFSNILQPFTSYSYDLSLDSLKQQVSSLRQSNLKLSKKVTKLKNQLQQYRLKSTKATQFIYMLRVNNINVDELYKKGVMKGRVNMEEKEVDMEELPRNGVELRGEEEWMLGLREGESGLTSQYVSVKSRR